MVYKVIGLMSGSSLDGLDIAFVQLQENGGKWNYEILNADCYEYNSTWSEKLQNATKLNALDYQLLHTEYGHYLGKQVNLFIEKNNLHHQVNLISSHGHTTFHLPEKLTTGQLGDGAAIASETNLPVVSDLRAMDIAFGGQGAPIVPIGEKVLLGHYTYFLNLGGIANISIHTNENVIAFDVCAANRVLNLLAEEKGLAFDEDGKLAAAGNINTVLLQKLNDLEYYKRLHPKSLANDFGTETVFPMIKQFSSNTEDAMRTYVAHIVVQIKNAIVSCQSSVVSGRLLVTGGGALNSFLIGRLKEVLNQMNIELIVPEENLIKYKEALIMALMGTLRWREEYNVLASVTGAKRNTIGGALWLGTEA
ncbi:MAG TPA: anhydro-N-acetylmuramic acid kinase [Chitinophagaceae bacterium]|nr:anhydro-N-acetylmuramic acid kinase [Chitinophagaceae bacterium]